MTSNFNILQHLVKTEESVCNNLHRLCEHSHLLCEQITDARQLTLGALFKVCYIALDEEVLGLREAKKQKKSER